MSLTEQDKEILLQEIQQIQRTLEAKGRTFVAEEENFDSSDEDCAEEQDLYRFKQEEESDDDGGEDDDDMHSSLHSVSIYDDEIHPHTFNTDTTIDKYSGILQNISNTGELMTNDGGFTVDDVSMLSHADSNLHTPKSSKKRSVKPKSSISSKVKKRIKQESEFGSKTTSENKKGKKTKSKKTSSDVSVESSSVPTKQIEKINMANLYVERLFGAFRNKKSKSSHLISVGDEKFSAKELKSSANLSTLENLLQVNRRYKDLLEDELKKVELAIARNGRAQQEVASMIDDKSVLQNVTFSGLSKACIGRFGNPYFKDNEGMGPPDNEDTIEKKRTNKVDPFNRGSKPWRNTEAEALEDGVYHNNLEKRLEPYMKKLKQFDKDYKEKQKMGITMEKTYRQDITKEITRIKELPREEIMADASLVDFFRISKNFLPTRDEFECRVQWCNVAHPSINQKTFTKEEDEQLIKLAKKYSNHQWETIAQELGTSRTPIQCLQRFQRTLNKEMIKTVWEEEDDEKLKCAVSVHGSNWVLVADALGNRTGDQCMHRWQKTLNPSIKRGKWSNEEDQILLKAVEKYGTKNWKVAQKEVPGRTDAQCRERYVSTLDPTKDWGAFTEEEDKKIIEFVEKYGVGKWSTIAKEFPNRRDNQIWRRYTQIQSDNYHKYRRGVIWKRRSVLNYFFHRKSERRDYSLEELDVTYSPSLTNMESRKLERTREELVKCGYSDDEITKKLARMHYEGHFSKSIYKPRQRPNSHGRPGRINTKRKSTAGKLASQKLLADVRNVLCSVKDPIAELPPPPVEPLKRKTKVERVVNIDGYHLIPKPVFKKKGRKETWMEKKVDVDVFRRKCYEVIMKLKVKAMWFEDARHILDNYYAMVQVPNNSRFHKQILHVYTDILVRFQTMFARHQEIENILITQGDVPMIMIKGDSNLNNDPTKKRQKRFRKHKVKKDSTFKDLVADAACNVYNTEDGHGEMPGPSNVKMELIKTENVNEIRNSYTVTESREDYISYDPQFLDNYSYAESPAPSPEPEEIDQTDQGMALQMQENDNRNDEFGTESNIMQEEYSYAKTPEPFPQDVEQTDQGMTLQQKQENSNRNDEFSNGSNMMQEEFSDIQYTDHVPELQGHNEHNEHNVYSEMNEAEVTYEPTPEPIPEPEPTPIYEPTHAPERTSVPKAPSYRTESFDTHLTSVHNLNQDNDMQPCELPTPVDILSDKGVVVEEVYHPGSVPDIEPVVMENQQSAAVSTSENFTVPAAFDSEQSTHNQQTIVTEQQKTQVKGTRQSSSEPSLQSRLHADKVNTFKLLLQALYVDTNGVINTLQGSPSASPGGMLSDDPFPTCYPLSPNSASLLGFRRLLLHRRVLGEIVQGHAMKSERLGIPVVHDKAYQNTKSYDALRKRFRSIFTWPAFLATFMPRYSEEPSNRSEQLNTDKSVHSNISSFRESTETATLNQSPSVSFTKQAGNINNTPVKSSKPLSAIDYKDAHGNQNKTRGDVNTNYRSRVEVSDEAESVSRKYIEQRKKERERENAKLYKKLKQTNHSPKHTRKRKNNVLNVTITSPFKKKCWGEQAAFQHDNRETIIIADDKPAEKIRITKKHISKRKSQTEDYHISVMNPVKKRRGRKKIDARQSNLETIFIPPAIKVEEIEENLSTEIVDNSESQQLIT